MAATAKANWQAVGAMRVARRLDLVRQIADTADVVKHTPDLDDADRLEALQTLEWMAMYAMSDTIEPGPGWKRHKVLEGTDFLYIGGAIHHEAYDLLHWAVHRTFGGSTRRD